MGSQAQRNSQGNDEYWCGYKLHWDVTYGGRIPVSCILTSANVHDSQVALPLMALGFLEAHPLEVRVDGFGLQSTDHPAGVPEAPGREEPGGQQAGCGGGANKP